MEFINRKQELRFLGEKWCEPGAQLIVLWGKRRVGKTELIKQFIENKPGIYFLSESTSEKDQLKKLSYAIGDFFRESLLQTRGFVEWEEAFRFLKEKNKKIVIVIDEFPYLIQSNSAVPTLFQKGWDEYLAKSKVYLVLLGSSVSMMETEVLGYRAPLYGRRTGQWHINPMAFDEISNFRRGKSFEDRLLHFAVGGGIPAYWLQFSKKDNFYSNIRTKLLTKGQFLYDEVEFILREELREPRYYFALLQAISQGKRKLSEIVNAVGLAQPTANKYLGVLSDLRIIEREIPVTEEKPLKSKRGLYKISDEFFDFWFRFIFPWRGELELGRIDDVLLRVKKGMPQYVSFVYEKVAKEVLWRYVDRIFPFKAVGKWWDKNEEVDIVAHNDELNSILFGEVKWSRKQVGTDIYQNLKKKVQKVTWGRKGRNEHFCLFSKTGFTNAMVKIAKKERVFLFTEDILKRS
jgi:AAA+ ATPase superfamily predicted ATPase